MADAEVGQELGDAGGPLLVGFVGAVYPVVGIGALAVAAGSIVVMRFGVANGGEAGPPVVSRTSTSEPGIWLIRSRTVDARYAAERTRGKGSSCRESS